MGKKYDKKKILIAVDNGIINLDLRKQINKLGFETESAKKLDLFTKDKIDLIILSESLEDDYLENKIIIDKRQIPVIFLTSREKKYPNHLVMPFNDEELMSIIEYSCNQIN